MRRPVVLILTQLLLWTLLAQVNHGLTPFRIYLFVGALYVVHAAMQETWRAGLLVTIFGGMLCDAATPVWFGTHTLLFTAAYVVLFQLRERIPRDDTIASILVALLTNLALFLLFSFTQIHRSPSPAAAWTRLVMDLICSQIFIVLITPWFLALQARALVLARSRRHDL